MSSALGSGISLQNMVCKGFYARDTCWSPASVSKIWSFGDWFVLHFKCYTTVLEDLTKFLVNEWWYFSLTQGVKIVATPHSKKRTHFSSAEYWRRSSLVIKHSPKTLKKTSISGHSSIAYFHRVRAGWGRLYSFLLAVLKSAHPQTTQRFNTAFVVIKFKSINARLSHASFELAKMPGLTQPLRQDYGNPHSKKKVGLLSGVASTNTDP